MDIHSVLDAVTIAKTRNGSAYLLQKYSQNYYFVTG